MQGEMVTSARRGAGAGDALLDALHDSVEDALDVIEVGGGVLVRAVRAGGDVEGEGGRVEWEGGVCAVGDGRVEREGGVELSEGR